MKLQRLKWVYSVAVAVVGAVTAFAVQFGKIPVRERLLLAGALGAMAVVSFSLLPVLLPRRKPPVGFKAAVIAGVVGVIALCGATVWFLDFTAAYHNVRLVGFERPAGRLMLYPPHSPVDLEVVLSVPQTSTLMISRPGSANAADVAKWHVESEDQFGFGIRVAKFKWPQELVIPYRISGSDRLTVQAVVTPPHVAVIREGALRMYRLYFYIGGGVLCIAGFGLLWCALRRRYSPTL